MTDNTEKAGAFYRTVLGVTTTDMPMGEGNTYTLLGPDQEQGAGIMQNPPR